MMPSVTSFQNSNSNDNHVPPSFAKTDIENGFESTSRQAALAARSTRRESGCFPLECLGYSALLTVILALMLVLPVSEMIIYQMKESSCDNNNPISIYLYLFVSSIVSFVSLGFLILCSFCSDKSFIKFIDRCVRLFYLIWCILGIVSLSLNSGGDCKSSHSFKMTLASVIIHLVSIVCTPEQKND